MQFESPFGLAQKVFEPALNISKILGWAQNFGPSQKNLAPVEVQGGRRQKVFIIFGQYQNKMATVYCILQIYNSSYSTSSASIRSGFLPSPLKLEAV